MAIQIPLTQGYVAVVDDCDSHLLSFVWRALTPKRDGLVYAVTTIDGKSVGMHRMVLNLPQGQVDHRDGNGLNNCRDNLRVCTNAQNAMNAKKRIGSSSRFKGVCWSPKANKWRARIIKDDKDLHLGLFASEEAAARQYDRAARIFFGKFARTNAALGLFEAERAA